MGPAEAEPWRCCRSIRVEEMGEAIPGFVRAGRPRSQVYPSRRRDRRSHEVQHPDVEAEGEGPVQALGGFPGKVEDLRRFFGSEDQPRGLAKR